MNLSISPENVAFFEALASKVRLRVIVLLAIRDRNIKELADCTGISSPMMVKHINKMEKAGLVTTRMVKRNGSVHKICTLVVAEYRMGLHALRRDLLPMNHTVSVPIGHYFDISCVPTCGLATENNVIRHMDEQRAFFAPERVNAQILWFAQGFVEYRVPNDLTPEQEPVEIEISLEMGSEAPDFAEDWPSDIRISLNGVLLCTWTSPGDFGHKQGVLTPDWWDANQYGLLKLLQIRQDGIYMDGEKLSAVTLEQVLAGRSSGDGSAGDSLQGGDSFWRLRFEVAEDAENVGGLTLYGKLFGNHAQDILIRTFYLIKGDEDDEYSV